MDRNIQQNMATQRIVDVGENVRDQEITIENIGRSDDNVLKNCDERMKDIKEQMHQLELSVKLALRRAMSESNTSEINNLEEGKFDERSRTLGTENVSPHAQEDMQKLIKTLVEDVMRLKESETTLQRNLMASKQEVERLQTQLAVFRSRYTNHKRVKKVNEDKSTSSAVPR